MHYGESMRLIRKGLGLSRIDVQEKTGISNQYLGEIERGEANPSIDILFRLAEAYGVTVSELIGESSPYNTKLNRILRKVQFTQKSEVYSLLNAMERLDGQEIEYLVKFLNKIKK